MGTSSRAELQLNRRAPSLLALKSLEADSMFLQRPKALVRPLAVWGVKRITVPFNESIVH